MAGEVLYSLQDVSYAYEDGRPVLDGVSLAINAGEKVVLLGANGSGKSTLQRVLDGLIFPQSGSVRFAGEELTEDSLEDENFFLAFRRRVGFVFQNSEAQLFNPSVREELAFGPLQLDLPAAAVKERVASLLEMFELEELADRPPYKLSGGERKKVALAAVLASNPEVLILDEPTAGLDPRSQRWLVEMLVKLNQAGKTIITATHDLAIVPVIADRVFVLGEDHRLAGEGSPLEILADRELLLKVNLIDAAFHEHHHQGYFHLHAH
ncbi:energy-coupling factor ABC transporter ATP-binding protein [Moorella sp. Hama-1]|uniref:energy-coupling factor ABC transporter ATP-binding protein n=1 Tax=Moorella sp. Hama-1 TaxID=2138101 RepID=UPI000D64C390|nr:ABC transporter ATP-binding protein [Moorella sp. Hama-1]BCV22145.1 cobalt ABC transporter [Moorella sp. Hama-1]